MDPELQRISDNSKGPIPSLQIKLDPVQVEIAQLWLELQRLADRLKKITKMAYPPR